MTKDKFIQKINSMIGRVVEMRVTSILVDSDVNWVPVYTININKHIDDNGGENFVVAYIAMRNYSLSERIQQDFVYTNELKGSVGPVIRKPRRPLEAKMLEAHCKEWLKNDRNGGIFNDTIKKGLTS